MNQILALHASEAAEAVGQDTALCAAMSLLDDNAEQLGSGLYEQFGLLLKKIADEEVVRTAGKRAGVALDVVADMPSMINSGLGQEYLGSDLFMKSLAIAISENMSELAVLGHHRLRSLLSTKWKESFVREVLDIEATFNCRSYQKLRTGMRALFVMKLGLLPLVIARLKFLNMTPWKLFPNIFLRGTPEHGDEECLGATALQIVHEEPRMLRWFLGKPEEAPWPNPVYPGLEDVYSLWGPISSHESLVLAANKAGGDNPLVNSPCTCSLCIGSFTEYCSDTCTRACCTGIGLPTLPQTEKQEEYEVRYREHNTWPIQSFNNYFAARFQATGSGNGDGGHRDRSLAADLRVMDRCRDKQKNAGAWWLRTRNGKRSRDEPQPPKLLHDRGPYWVSIHGPPMEADAHRLPRQMLYAHRMRKLAQTTAAQRSMTGDNLS